MDSMIPVFIASPADAIEFRNIVKKSIEDLAQRFAVIFNKTVVPIMWEWFSPITRHDLLHPQFEILRHIQPFSIFIGIVCDYYGTKIGDESGTEIEINKALELGGSVQILTYFKKHDKRKKLSITKKEQYKQISDFKERLKTKNAWICEFKSKEDFKARIGLDILEAGTKLILSQDPERISNYHNFFEFGSHVRLGSRPLIIIYPPLTDAGPGHPARKQDWEKYLFPHVVYEDSKTIQDLEEIMRLVSRDYKTITTDSPDMDMAEIGDRAWVCIPRNSRAREELNKIGPSRVRFTFENLPQNPPQKNPFPKDPLPKKLSECILKWNSNYDEAEKVFKNSIIIHSPLSKYLKHSKRRPSGTIQWDPSFGFTLARDYAVIAKFRVKKESSSNFGEFYYNYFFGGIRGLGTWGIGHLIDHQSTSFIRMANDQKGIESIEKNDIQILIEVTYYNYRIIDIKNVSNETQDYFDERYSDSFIIEELKKRHLRK